VLILFVISILYLKPNGKENEFSSPRLTDGDDPFLIGTYRSGTISGMELMKDSAGFNIWHRYLEHIWYNGIPIPHGWTDEDLLYNLDSTNYLPTIKAILDANGDSIRTIMQRPKLDWLCFGQRSDYQCEDMNDVDPDFWFYTYKYSETGNSITDNSLYSSGQFVRFCNADPVNPGAGAGYVVRGLRANREQCRIENPWNPGKGDSHVKWFVKPRIRIDSTIVDNNPDANVCRIEVLDFEGSTIKNVIIKAEDFQDQYNNYDGRYLDEFIFKDTTKNLEIDSGHIFNPKGGSWSSTNSTCQVDFRVFWYGECDMWIDYVRVEDERANRLLTGTDQEYELMLRLEAELARHNGSPIRFYIDEFEFNNLPCMKYVSRKLKELSGISFSVFNWLGGYYSLHVPDWIDNVLSVDHFRQYFIDSVGIKELIIGSYPFKCGDKTKPTYIPNTLRDLNPPRPVGPFYVAVQPNRYDIWLQGYLDTNTFIPIINSFIPILESGINFISPIQTHLYYTEGEKLREPTNEEIELMVNLSLSYGAKGIMYYEYHAFGKIGYKPAYEVALAELDGDRLKPRYVNDYGQEKWQKIKDINKKLKVWGPYLMSFNLDDTESYIFRNSNERNALIQNTYFLTAKTFKPGSGTSTCRFPDTLGNKPAPYGGLTNYDCIDSTYLQVALFNNPNDSYQYFMVINRRCSPFIDTTTQNNNGGRRFVRILFDANDSAFNGYNNWNIIDLETGTKILGIDKTKTENLDLGWYMPGEGKLYKIVPVL
jgi:hypothetical protein